MGWLKKLPRFIRPPAKVREQIERIKGKDFLPPGVKQAVDAVGKLGGKDGAGLMQNANEVIQKTGKALDNVNQSAKDVETVKTVMVIGLVIAVIFMLGKGK